MNSLDVRRLGLALLLAPALALAGCRCCRPCTTPCAAPEAVAVPMPTPVAAGSATTTAASQPTQVLVQVQVFEVTAQAAWRLHFDPTATRSNYGVMSAKAGEELAASLWNEEGVRLLNMPAIMTLFGQEASLFVGESYASPPPAPTATPPLTHAVGEDLGDDWSGLRTAILVAPPAADGTLSVDFTLARRDAPAKGTEPDLAALRASEVSVRALKMGLRPGETAVLASPAGPGSASARMLVLVGLKVVPATAAR